MFCCVCLCAHILLYMCVCLCDHVNVSDLCVCLEGVKIICPLSVLFKYFCHLLIPGGVCLCVCVGGYACVE